MVLPLPKEKEPQSEFINRCMTSEVMNKEFPENSQRLAVCHAQFDKPKKLEEEKMEENIESKEKKFKRYIEPFATKESLFESNDKSKYRLLNYRNKDAAFAYRFIRDHSEYQFNYLKQLNWDSNKEKVVILRDSIDPMDELSRFYRFCYLSDHQEIEEESEDESKEAKLFKNIDKLKTNLKGSKIFSLDEINFLNKFNKKDTFALINYPVLKESKELFKKNIQRLCKSLKSFKGKFILNIQNNPVVKEIFAEFKIKEMNEKELAISNEKEEESIDHDGTVSSGIYLRSPHARMIWEGHKKMIISESYLKENIGTPLYFSNGDLCYGILKLKEPFKIDMNGFKYLGENHQITEDEIREWSPGVHDFYAYEFSVLDLFGAPKYVELKKEIFSKEIKFLSEGTTGSGDTAGSFIDAKSLQPIATERKKRKIKKKEK